jgi:hypothetical protein
MQQMVMISGLIFPKLLLHQVTSLMYISHAMPGVLHWDQITKEILSSELICPQQHPPGHLLLTRIFPEILHSAQLHFDVPSNYAISLKDLTTTTVTDLRTATYTYNNSPAEANSRNFELTIGVTLSEPGIVVNPTTLDFGTVKTDASKALGVLITNTGDRVLNITDMAVDGSIHYSFEGSTTATLNKDDTTTVFVRFHPKTAGTLTGTLTVTSNDPDNGSLVVNLTGIGQSLSPNISVWLDTLKFGDVIAGNSSDLGFRVSNTGDTALTVSNVVATGTGFSYSGDTGFTVNINDSSEVTVRFAPVTTGDFTGTLTITSNDPDTPTKTVQLSGKGTTSSSSHPFTAGWNLMSIPQSRFKSCGGYYW